MSYNSPQRQGLPPWAKWSLIGCGGCLTVAVVTVIAGVFLVSRNFKIEQLNVSDKPDPPLTATAQQLLPRRVGPFVLQKASRAAGQQGQTSRGWQGSYTAGGRQVNVVVVPSDEARRNPNAGSPFGSALQRGGQNPNTAVLMSMKMGGKAIQVVVWQKPNWTVMIQSEDAGSAAGEFARAYRPLGGR